MSRARQAAPRPPAPRYTPSPDSLRGCAAPPRATLSVPELGHEAEQSRFKPTKPLPVFPKTETLHPLIPRPTSSFRHVCRAVLALPVCGAHVGAGVGPLLLALTHTCPRRSETAGPCPRSPRGRALPLLGRPRGPAVPDWRAGGNFTDAVDDRYVVALDQLTVYRQSSTL